MVGELHTRTVLSTVRCLAAYGWQVHVAGQPRRGMSTWSRAVTGVHVVPAPADGADAFRSAVHEVLDGLGRPVVLAAGDAELKALAAGDRAPGVPDAAALATLLDKHLLSAAAQRHGVRTPGVVDGAPSRWPVVAKPAQHHQPGATVARWEAQVVDAPGVLAALRAAAAAAGVSLLVQEHVAGDLVALVLVRDRDGRLVGRSQQRAVRTWPPRAGVSARAVTVPVDERLVEGAAALLSDVRWVGPVELQYLVPADGEPCLIDVNPRVYGSVGLAVAAGVPVPHLGALTLIGEAVDPVPDGQPGVVYQWLQADLRSTWAARPGAAAAAEVLGVLRVSRPAVWDVRDPAPSAAAAARLAARALRRVARRTAAGHSEQEDRPLSSVSPPVVRNDHS